MPVSDLVNDEKQARALYDKRKYKDAIKLYKQLLKHESRDEWQQALAQCYLKRALEFAKQGRYKEALVLWENYSQLVEPPYPDFDHFVVWQLLSGSEKDITTALSQLNTRQLDQHYPRLAQLLGMLILFKAPEYQHALPQDSIFIVHLNMARSALQAFRDEQLEDMQAILKKIPYRSAFRNFCTVLKAVVSSNIETCNKQLARIPTDSPYWPLTRLLHVCGLTGSSLADELVQLTHQQRRIIYAIKGLDKTQQKLVEQLAKNKNRLNDKAKFNLAVQFKNLGDVDYAQRFCRAMLQHYPAGRKDFIRHFRALTPFEEHRLKAIRCEQHEDFHEAEYHWQQSIKYLKKEAGHDLEIALILRHIAEKYESSGRVLFLGESLRYDPDDKETHLKLLNYFYQYEPDKLETHLKNALKQLPEDIDILSVAMRQAVKKQDFKAARKYARKILKSDPVHSEARLLEFESASMIVRQLLKEKAYTTAEKEVQKLKKQQLTKPQQLAVQILEGFLCFSVEDKQRGLDIIVAALEQLNNDSMVCHFQAAMEALLCGKPVATVLRALPPITNPSLSNQELDSLCDLIRSYLKYGSVELLHKALGKIKAPVKKSLAQSDLDEQKILAFCALLADIKYFELLRYCVATLSSDKTAPIWVYYRVYSKLNGQPDKLKFTQRMQLEQAMAEAHHNNDHRALVLIERFLTASVRTNPPADLDILDALLGKEDEIEPLEQLFGHLSDNTVFRIERKIDSFIGNLTPEKLVREFQKKAGKDVNLMRIVVSSPDFLTALLFFKAAEQLNIDIGVTLQDALDKFGGKL